MKKFLLLLCISLPIFSFAQPGPLDVNLGIKAGMNFTRIQGSTWSGGYRSGIVGGAFASVGVKKLGAQAEALISTTTMTGSGAKFNAANLLKNPSDSTTTGDFSVTYLSIPLLLNLKIFGNAILQLGPQYTSVISLKDKNNLLKKSTDNVFNQSDVSGVVGVQLKLPRRLHAGVRYIFGLSDQNMSSIGETWKLSTIQLHLGYSFL